MSGLQRGVNGAHVKTRLKWRLCGVEAKSLDSLLRVADEKVDLRGAVEVLRDADDSLARNGVDASLLR